MRMLTFFLIGLVFMSAAVAEPTPVERELVRRLEAMHEQQTGVPLEWIECEVPENRLKPFEFECPARDSDGDRFIYLLTVNEEGEVDTRVFQPYDQISTRAFEAFDRVGRAFTAAFSESDWEALERLCAPELKDAADPANLAPLRNEVGKIQAVEGLRVSTPTPEYTLVDYRLETEAGTLWAMLKFTNRNPAEPELWGYVVTPEPGSSLRSRQLRAASVEPLSRMLGAKVTDVDAPLQDLARMGDWVEGTATLADGGEASIAIRHKGSAFDLDTIDYTYANLDTARVLRGHFASAGYQVMSVDCPREITPHEEQMDCTVILKDGERREVTVARSGTDQRLIAD